VEEKPDGRIVHKPGCSDWFHPNHTTYPLQKEKTMPKTFHEVADTEREVITCGLEHPYWENPCVLDYGHKDLHEDAEGHEWNGKP